MLIARFGSIRLISRSRHHSRLRLRLLHPRQHLTGNAHRRHRRASFRCRSTCRRHSQHSWCPHSRRRPAIRNLPGTTGTTGCVPTTATTTAAVITRAITTAASGTDRAAILAATRSTRITVTTRYAGVWVAAAAAATTTGRDGDRRPAIAAGPYATRPAAACTVTTSVAEVAITASATGISAQSAAGLPAGTVRTALTTAAHIQVIGRGAAERAKRYRGIAAAAAVARGRSLWWDRSFPHRPHPHLEFTVHPAATRAWFAAGSKACRWCRNPASAQHCR